MANTITSLRMGIAMEEKCLAFYSELRKKIGSEPVRDLLGFLIREEHKHRKVLAKLLLQQASSRKIKIETFPQRTIPLFSRKDARDIETQPGVIALLNKTIRMEDRGTTFYARLMANE